MAAVYSASPSLYVYVKTIDGNFSFASESDTLFCYLFLFRLFFFGCCFCLFLTPFRLLDPYLASKLKEVYNNDYIQCNDKSTL